jgi:hypothetical protein
LASALEVLENLLGESLPALGPTRRKDEFIQRRLVWLFDKIAAAIEYHEKYSTPEWETLRQGLTEATATRIVVSAERLSVGLQARGGAARALSQLLGRVRSYRLEAPTEHATAVPSVVSCAPPAAAVQPAPLVREGLVRMEVLAAQPFVALCRRLKAFEQLIARQDLRRAAILAEQIAQAIEHFDPLSNFPDLFARHAALLSKHAVRLDELQQDRQSPSWQAMARHARVDLDGFVEG